MYKKITTISGTLLLLTILTLSVVGIVWMSKSINLSDEIAKNIEQVAQTSAVFGNDTLGSSDINTYRSVCAGPFAAPQSGTLSSISIYGKAETADAKGSAAIYSSPSSGAPIRMAVSPSTVTLPTTNGWTSIPISASLTAGTNYYLCAWASSNFAFRYINNVVDSKMLTGYTTSWPNWDASYIANSTMTGRKAVMFGTYSTSNTGGNDTGEIPPVIEPEVPETPTTPTDPEPSSPTTIWYVDSAATGAGTGKSWTDAWTSPTSVVWGTNGVKAGDTLYISGGQSSKTYSASLNIGASGTASNPIKVRVGQETGHNGVAVLPFIGINTHRHIIVDGSRSQSFVPPKNVWNIDDIKSNIGIRVTNPSTTGIFVSGNGGEDNTIRYVEVGPIGTVANINNIHGIQFLNLTSIDDWLIEYVWIHDIQNDGINMNASTGNPEKWDAMVVRWAIVENTGDDGIQIVRNGFTLENSFLRDHWLALYNGHPDQLQFSGVSSRYLKVVNNIMRNKANSLIIGEHYVTEGGQLGPMLIAGNIFYNTRDWYYTDTNSPGTVTGGQAYGVTFDAWRPNNDISVNRATWTGFHFLNNTVYYQRTVPIKVGRAEPEGRTRSVRRLDFTNSAIRNNLVIESAWNSSNPSPFLIAGAPAGTDPSNGIFYDSSSFPMTHNVVAGSNKKISWGGIIHSTGEAFTGATGMPGNVSMMPSFSSLTSYDFKLNSGDTAAKDKGYNLSALVDDFPELGTDLYGNRRGQGDGWDIGAYEYPSGGTAPDPGPEQEPEPVPPTTGGLQLHLSFDSDDFNAAGTSVNSITQRYFTDASGNGNTANCQVNFTKNGISFNQCPLPTTGPDGSQAARFVGNTCERSSDYLAIAKDSSISDLTRGTISIWATDENTLYHNDQIIDAFGQMQPNTWQIGEDGANYKAFTANDDLGLETDLLTFPGETRPVNSWNHYAVTWDGSTVRGYWNGILFQETPLKRFSKFSIGNYLALSALMHGSNRNISDAGNCISQYGGTPGQDYTFPNAGFMQGKIDDVRIYSRALSGSEIASLASPSQLSNTYLVRVTHAGTGTGSVMGNRTGGTAAEALTCGKRCAEAYPAGSTVTLVATPAVDSVFTGWSGACSGTGSCTIPLNNHKTVTATFTQAYPVVDSFQAESGTITSPFISTGGILRQVITTPTLTGSGRAEYTFTVPESGTYLVSAITSIPSSGSNSIFIDIDQEPTDPASIWHSYTTGGDEERFVVQGSNTSGNNPVREFTLSAGSHKLIVRGRERNFGVDSWMIIKKGAVTTPVPTDTTSPALSNINASNITQTGATITWTTSEEASSQVQYGLTTAYGSNTTLSASPKTSHSVSLTNLIPNTLYNYRVISTDAAGNTAISNNGTFSTLSIISVPNTPAPVNNPPANVPSVTKSVVAIDNIPTQLPANPVAPGAGSSTFFFTRPLRIGTRGEDVKILQQTLNKLGFVVAASGAGSAGKETTYFGRATTLAVQKFQCATLRLCSGSPSINGYGNFGTASRAALYIRLGGGVDVANTPNTAAPVAESPTPNSFNRSLRLGSTGADVKALQQFLNQQGFTVATSGAGSVGKETAYFGPATKRALARFQAANNIRPAVGNFGPITRTHITIRQLLGN